MDEQPITMRIFPGELSSVYFASVMAFRSTPTLEVIRLSLERLQIYEDKSLYELYEGRADDPKESWRKLDEDEFPISIQELWQRNQQQPEKRFYLQRKEHASLVLSEIVSQYISPDANEGRVEDLCNLEELSEQDMFSNLRARFNNKNIYTYVGSILISVNPYYYYSIYNPKYTAMYMGKPFGALPPHIFAIADNAYHSMLNDRYNQSIIISGESGAGKTESTKFLLHHIMSLSAKLDESQSLELITLGTGPVLEAFGNARTVANNNSSRFGKFILIKFRENGAYHSASIEKYLLEKSRIVSQAPEERNYHVFYYLLSGADAETKAELQLMDIDCYKYLTQGSSLAPENGVEEYHRLRQSLSMLQFSDELQMRMFTVLSAILHIGNVSFVKKDGEEAVVVGNRDTLTLISSLLQVEEKTLHGALTTRKSLAGGTDFFVTPYRIEEAVAMRDTLARALYGALFDWIVDQVNVTLAACGVQASHKGNSIGVLDIFGFEVFQKNSFEQFCINYANEQLQQYFNKHIFKIEQVEYEAEGIEWSSVPFVDNQECLDLVAKKPTGLLQLLDEECSFPGADDNTLFQKFERQQKNHPHYRSPQLKQQDPQFTILHYASEVTYSVKGFREKNRDLLRSDIVNVLQASRMDLVRALIGLPPYTVYRWHMAYLKVMAVFAFRRAGELHRAKLENRFVPFKFRHGSSPILSHQESLDGGKEKYVDPSSQPLTPSKPSAEAFPLEHGRLRIGGGLRTSRSYDLITDAVKEEEKAAKEKERDGDQSQPASSHVHSHSLPYGASPRSSRRNLSSTPQGDATFPLRTKSQPVAVSTPTPTGTGSPISSPSQMKKQLAYARTKPSPPTVLAKPAKSSTTTTKQREGKEGTRSHASSVTKPRKHRSNQRSKEAPANLTPKIWRSAPRMKSSCSSSDPRLLHSLARKPSLRVGPSKTVSAQFHMSLVSLMERLEMTNPFFVRCLKSNNSKSPCQFDDDLVLRQLRYTGMMETVKIRKSGYSVRVDFKDFYEKYQFLIGAESDNLGDQINTYLTGLGFGSEHFQIGKTKVFMRDKQKQALQTELGDKVLAKIIIIQRWTRAKLLRCRFLHFRRSAITIQCAVRCWRARKRANYLRKRVCSAVLIQSSWKTYTARKKLILLKQAAIILQAHYKGRLARKRYVVLLEKFREEKERKRKEEELLRKKREREKLEAQRKERKERRERELQEALRKAEEEQRLHQQQEEATAAQDEQDVVVRRRTKSDCHDDRLALRETRMLDAEVVDTLFQFDSIVSELERETLAADNGISPMITPSPRRKLSPSSSSQPSLEQRSTPSSELSSSIDSDICREPPSSLPGVSGGSKQFPSPPRHRALPNVNQIKQQFLSSPQRPVSAPLHRDLKHDKFPLVKGNVKHIVAQMQTTTPEVDVPRSLTPPIDEQAKKRHSIAIQSKILEFNQQREEKKERRLSQSYTPPSVRRKIQSPFLRQESKVKSEEVIMHAPIRTEKHFPTDKMEEYSPPTSTEEARMDEEYLPVKTEWEHSPTKMEELSLARREEEPPSSREKSPKRRIKEASPARVKEQSPSRTKEQSPSRAKELSPTRAEEDLPTRTDRFSPARTEKKSRSPSKEPSPVRTKEKSPIRTEDMSPIRTKELSPIRLKEKTPTPASPHRLVVRAEELLNMEEVNQTLDENQKVRTVSEKRNDIEETQSKLADLVTKTEGGIEDSTVLSPPGTGDSTESDHLVSFVVLSPPHRKPSKKRVKVESPSHGHKPPAPEPPVDVATPEDIELNFDDLQGTRTSTSDVESEHRHEPLGRKDSLMFESPHHVEVVIGVKENGVFSPPKVVDGSEETSLYGDRPNQYDHLKAKSQYDHLAPLEPGEDPYQPFQRHRSASDVTSHRIRPLSKRSFNEEFAESEVVHREEHRYGSLQQRKRVALSVADPTDYMPQSGFEESSEFTRRLTSEEILHLNQRQHLHSPSDRLRLFSFTKRHLKLPFSRSKKQRDKDKPVSPEKEPFKSLTPLKQKRSSPTSARFSASERHDGGRRSHHDALAHSFKQTTSSRFSMHHCEVCHKGFTGFMKQALRCVGCYIMVHRHCEDRVPPCKAHIESGSLKRACDCYIMVHRHCEDRVPPCKAHIESGSYVTMSRNKVVKKLEDLDNLGQFLLEKIATLSRDEQPGSLVDRVFKLSLSEFHTSLISSYSLTLQSSLESSTESHRSHGEKPSPAAEEPKVSITFSQLVNNFSNIFKGIAKREGLNDPCHISIGINQIKTFLDEFSKARRAKRYSASINPSALRRKAPSGKELQPKVHKGHRFLPRQFKVATVCEYCSKLVPLLESGEVCEVCGYTCHEDCYKKTHKKCEGKGRSKPIPEYNPKPAASNQFGVPLTNLVPPGVVKVPPILEKCFQYLENQGLYTQGVYRKSAGVSSKKAVRAALEEDPENASLEGCSVHAVAAAVGGFFRELPEPLLTRELYTEFIRAMDLTSKKEKLETLHKLVHRLPDLNYAVFERLVFHLARFAQHEHINKMSPNNLAIIFAPCLLQSKEKKNPEEILRDLQKQTECLEVIITEQVEKLTATLRGIRSLTSHARSKASKLTQLIDQFESTQGDSSEKPSDQNIVGSSLSEEERKRLANELEEIERERVELTVNLPKLEPFILSEDELEPHEQESGSSEHWTLSPSPPQSPSLNSQSSGSFFSRSLQGFPPIREAGERASFSMGGSVCRRRASSMKSPPKSPSNPSIVVETSSPSGSPLPTLKHLTKDRVSQKPTKRPPSRKKEASNRTEGPANPASRYIVDTPTNHQESPLNSHWGDDSEDIMFMESTV